MINDNFETILELTLLVSNIKRKICDVYESFLFFSKIYEKNIHNILYLMVDPRFKSFHLMFFINHEEGVIIVEEYDQRFLYFMFLKCYRHLHSIVEFDSNV